MTEIPKCPGCGREMVPIEDFHKYFYACLDCGWKSPYGQNEKEGLDLALKRAEPKNRVLTLEEARNAEVDTFGTAMHWLELKIHPYKCEGEEIRHAVLAVSIFFENESEDGEADVMYSCTGEPSAWLFQKEYGKRWRCWLRKPTKEEMEGTPWA